MGKNMNNRRDYSSAFVMAARRGAECNIATREERAARGWNGVKGDGRSRVGWGGGGG